MTNTLLGFPLLFLMIGHFQDIIQYSEIQQLLTLRIQTGNRSQSTDWDATDQEEIVSSSLDWLQVTWDWEFPKEWLITAIITAPRLQWDIKCADVYDFPQRLLQNFSSVKWRKTGWKQTIFQLDIPTACKQYHYIKWGQQKEDLQHQLSLWVIHESLKCWHGLSSTLIVHTKRPWR